MNGGRPTARAPTPEVWFLPPGTAGLRCGFCACVHLEVLVRRSPRGLIVVGLNCPDCAGGVAIEGGVLIGSAPAR
jgi:hypothetical protein